MNNVSKSISEINENIFIELRFLKSLLVVNIKKVNVLPEKYNHEWKQTDRIQIPHNKMFALIIKHLS